MLGIEALAEFRILARAREIVSVTRSLIGRALDRRAH